MAMKNNFFKALFNPGQNVPCQSAQLLQEQERNTQSADRPVPDLFRPLWIYQSRTAKMRPNLIAMKNIFGKALFKALLKPGPNIPCRSAQTDKSVSSA